MEVLTALIDATRTEYAAIGGPSVGFAADRVASKFRRLQGTNGLLKLFMECPDLIHYKVLVAGKMDTIDFMYEVLRLYLVKSVVLR